MKRHAKAAGVLMLAMAAALLSGCGSGREASGKTVVEIVQYKPEAIKAFEALEEKFNSTHDDSDLFQFQRGAAAGACPQSRWYRSGYGCSG